MDFRVTAVAAVAIFFTLGSSPSDAANQSDGAAAYPGAVLAPGAHLGISKQMIYRGLSGGFPLVAIRLTVRNYGDQVVSNIAISEDLNAVYGTGNYTHIIDPVQVNGEGSLNYNANFNGNTETALINAGSALAPGEDVIFEFSQRVTVLTDQGFGTGIYQNQVTVVGTDPAMNPISDLSADGPNPDPDGNDNPGDNSTPSRIDLNLGGPSAIGVGKIASVAANVATFDLYLEAFGTFTISALSLNDRLDTVFGEGNYAINSPPILVAGPGTIALNPGFNGSSDDELLAAGSTLAGGAVANIRFSVTVLNISDRGFGLGNYQNQAVVAGQTPIGGSISDRSNNTVDPDPDGNDIPSENNATSFSIPAGPTGLAKSASVLGNQATLDFYLRNYGSATSSNLALTDNLDAVFGAGNYLVSAAPVLIDNPGTLVLNASFNGSTQPGLLAVGSSLAAGATAQIRVVINITALANPQGLGVGVYQNQAQVSGVANGIPFADLSDEGSNPDANGNNDPGSPGEDTPTRIVLYNAILGTAVQPYVSGTLVTIDYLIENLGGFPASSVSLTSNLDAVFGVGNFTVPGPPTLIEGPATLTLNGSYTGTPGGTALITGGSLPANARVRIRTVVNITNTTDQGFGFGIYHLSVMANGLNSTSSPLTDISDWGVVTDTNGNGNAGDPGENDVAIVTLGDEGILGASLQATLLGNVVTYDVYLENFGSSNLANLRVPDNLDAVFGSGNYSISTPPVFVDDPGTLVINGGFNGSGNRELISSGNLNSLDTAQLRFGVTIINPADVGLGFGIYSSQVLATAFAPLGSLAADFSDAGIDPDPNANGNPADTGESDPTVINYTVPVIGVAKQASVSDGLVTFDFFIRNLGQVPLTMVSVIDDLVSVFGAGNYQILTPPALIGPPRGLTPNPNFDGGGNTQLIAPGSTLAPSVQEQIRVVIRVLTPTDQGSGFGVYSNQAAASSFQGLSDLSDAGTNPDPNGNGSPADPGENDPTAFTVLAADVAISMTDSAATAVPGSTISYTTTARNDFGQTATNVVVTSSFAAFLTDCSSTSVATGGATGNDPGPQPGNLNDTGITLPVGATVTYSTTCSIPSAATGILVSSAAIASDVLDTNLANNSASDTDTLTPRADLAITKDNGVTTAIPGTALTYTIVVSNSGPSNATGATVTDLFPTSLTGVSYTASSVSGATGFTAAGGGNISDTVNLPAGSSITYVAIAALRPSTTTSLFNTATVSAPAGVSDPVSGNNSATDSDALDRQSDLAITKTDGATIAVPGTPISYSIVVSNLGPGDAGATVTDVFPGSLSACTWTCLAAGGGSCTAAGTGNIADSISLPVSATASYTANCNIADSAIGSLANTATVAGSAGATDPVPGNNSATDTNTMAPSADLAVTLIDTPDPVTVGSNLTYVATLTNAGPSAAQDVTLMLPLPAPGDFVSAVPSAGGTCTTPIPGANGNVSCIWSGPTPRGTTNSRSVTVLVQIPLVTPNNTVLSRTVSASSLTADPTPSNNTATTTTTVEAAADLSIALTATPVPAIAGDNLSYIATLTNNGPADAQAATITLPVPAGTNLVSATASAGGNCNAISPVICTWAGTTAPATDRVATISVLVDPAQTAALNAVATASSATVDLVPGNNSATALTAVAASSDLSISLVDLPDPVTAGTDLTYIATVDNGGPSTATGVTISMPPPAGTSLVSGTVSGGGSCVGAPVVCSVMGSMAHGATRTATLIFAVAPSVPSGSVINASASVASAAPDPNTGNNATSTATAVIASADLVLGFSASASEVRINVPVSFTATSLNQGPSDAQDVILSITLSPDFRYSSHIASGATCTTPQVGTVGAVSCSWAGATAPDGMRTLEVVAYSNVEGASSVSANTGSSTPDPVANNNLGGVSVQVGDLMEAIPALDRLALLLLGTLICLIGLVKMRRHV